MAASNHERVGKALDLLKTGLRPYFEREMRATHGEKWIDEAASTFRDGRLPRDPKGAINWDSHAILYVMSSNWSLVFSKKLGKAERNLIEELRNTRNTWAHQKPFSTDDTYRAIDSAARLLRAIGAEREVDALRRLRSEVLEELRTMDNGADAASQPEIVASPVARAVGGHARIVAEAGSVSGKYRPLHAHLMRVRTDEVTLTFSEIEQILGTTLPPSAYKHRAWWGNEDPYKTMMRGKRGWLLAGFKAYPDMRSQRVVFKRSSSPTPREHRERRSSK